MGDIIQSKEEIEAFYKTEDPWGYRTNPEDLRRRDIILSEIPSREYKSALDIGCGEGFLTCRLPGQSVVGVDLSVTAIERARQRSENAHCEFVAAGLLELPAIFAGAEWDQLEPSQCRSGRQFDLILITGLVYRQYFGESHVLIYDIVDQVLAPDGVLVTSHIDEWYRARFPYLMVNYLLFSYREFTQRLEVYAK